MNRLRRIDEWTAAATIWLAKILVGASCVLVVAYFVGGLWRGWWSPEPLVAGVAGILGGSWAARGGLERAFDRFERALDRMVGW